MSQKPNTVKYLYFDKDGRQISEVNVKGNVALTPGTRDDSTSSDPTQSDSKETPSQQVSVKTELSVKPEKINFQASHNGQIYLVTSDGKLRPTIRGEDLHIIGDQSKIEKSSKVMPGTNMQYRSRGINHLNRNGKVKRPMNAFMLWAREFRGKLAEQMPNASNAEISVGLGQVWANLPASEKQHFYLEAERVKNQHRKDFPGWVYQPNISKREIQKDVQHSQMWQRFVKTKEADGNIKVTTYRPVKLAKQQNQQSMDVTSASSPTVADDSKKSQQEADDSKKSQEAITATSSANSNIQTKTEVKSTLQMPTLDQKKKQQESKIDTKTILSTVKQVVVPSSLQPRNSSNTFQTFSQFKQEILSSQKLRTIAPNISKSSHVKPGERTVIATTTSTEAVLQPAPVVIKTSVQAVLQPAPVVTPTQLKTQPTTEVQARTTLTNQINRQGRPNSFLMKYNYIPESKSMPFIPSTTPQDSSTTIVKPANQVNQLSQQNIIETHKTPRQRSATMPNQTLSQRATDPRLQRSQHPKQTSNVLKSNSTENIQLPIAIPSLPQIGNKTDGLWPFPFPPVEQAPQTHLLYEGTVPDPVNSKTDLSDPYAPFYFDNYVNQVRSTELQVDVNGWQQYLNDDNASGTEKQPASYFSVKQCPSDLEICPSPASHTLSRNQTSNLTPETALTGSTADVHKMSNVYRSQDQHNGQQSWTKSTSTSETRGGTSLQPTSTSETREGTSLQPTSLSENPTLKQQTVVIQGHQGTGLNNAQATEGSGIQMAAVHTLNNGQATEGSGIQMAAVQATQGSGIQMAAVQATQGSGIQMAAIHTLNNGQATQGSDIQMAAVHTLTGDLIHTTPQNFGDYTININPVTYSDDRVYQYDPSSNVNAAKDREKTQGVEFGSIMSNAVSALHGDMDVYNAAPEQYPFSEYNESVPYMNPQLDIPSLYVQPSGSNENCQIFKYQEENNRPIKKRSYKIIEGLLENEVWRAKFLQNKSDLMPTQSNSDTVSTPEQLQNVTASTSTELQDVSGPAPTQLQDVTGPAPTQLQGVTGPAPPQLQDVTTPAPTQLQNVTGPVPTQLQDVTSPAPTQLQDVTGPVPTQLQDVTGPVPKQLQDVMGPAPTQLQDVMGPAPTQLQDVMGPAPTQLQEVTGPAPTQLQDVTGPAPPQLQDVTGPATTQLQDITGPAPTQLQDVTGPVPTQLQDVMGPATTQLQDITGPAPTLQDVTGPVPTQLQDITGPAPTLQDVTAATPTQLQDVIKGCASQDRVQIHSEDEGKEENEASCHTFGETEASCHTLKEDEAGCHTVEETEASCHTVGRDSNREIVTETLEKVNSGVVSRSAGDVMNETKEPGEYVEQLLGSRSKLTTAENVNSRDQNNRETTVLSDKESEDSENRRSLNEEVAELEVKRTENSEILEETEHNDSNGSNLQDDMDNGPEEKSGIDAEGDSSNTYSEVEIVIDNAEEQSDTYCEEKYYSNNLTETASETTHDGSPEEVAEEFVKDDASESLSNPGENLNSMANGNMQQNLQEKLRRSNKLKHPRDYPNLESGDAPTTRNDLVLETENKSARSGNKRRHQYNSPIRTSKRHKQ